MLSAELTELKCVCHTSLLLTPVITHFSVEEKQLSSVNLKEKKNN